MDIQVPGQSPDELRRIVLKKRGDDLVRAKAKLTNRLRAQNSIAFYIRQIWPWWVMEEIHLLMAGYLESLCENVIDRLMIFMAPRTGKSRMASIATPSYYMGKFPTRETMQAGHSVDLARDFGREARGLMLLPRYQEIFPGVTLHHDSRAAGRWHTNKGGGYIAAGLDSGIAGKGYHLGVIDDPLSEQNARSKLAQKRAFDWYGSGFYTRQSPDVSSILLMGTRWDKGDLFGQLLALQNTEDDYADEWSAVKIPAILDTGTAETLNELADDPLLKDTRFPKRYKFKAGDSFAPRRWPLDKLLRRKANLSSADWEALYQQEPTVNEGAILKRSWWRKWPHDKPPRCSYIIQVYDTAFEEGEENDFSARTTWGIFEQDDQRINDDGIVLPSTCAILVERMNRRLSFPALRKEAAESFQLYQPNRVLIEKKASGHSLIQELKRNRLPIVAIKVDKGQDKVSRTHAASGIFENGFMYYMDRTWAKEVISQCAEFPNGDFDDMHDTVVYAALFLRRMYHLRLPIDDKEAAEGVNLTPRRLYG